MKAAKLTFHDTKFTRYYITNADEMAKCCHILLKSKAKHFGLDIETAKKAGFEDFIPVKRGNRTIGPCPGLCPLLSEIRLIQIYDPIRKAVFVFDALIVGKSKWRSSGILRALLTEKKFIAHNGVFEVKHFTHNGFPNMHVDCSMLLSIMVDRAEHSPFEPEEETDEPPDGLAKYKRTSYSLDNVIGRLYGVRISKHYQTSNWNTKELSTKQINYAALDAVLTYRVAIDMMKKVKQYKMEEVYTLDRDMQHVVADMELTGLAIDAEQHTKLIEQWKVDHAKHTEECEKRFKKVNLNSSKQLNAWARSKYKQVFWENYWPRTDASTDDKIILSFGKDSLKEVVDVIERKFKKDPKALQSLLGYKTVAKLLSTYGETLQKIIHPVTGRLHCSFIIGETRTGRLSSREPNLQNLPRDKNVRKLFVAPKGKHLLVADYSQIEMRTAAALSEDPVMTNAFIKNIDLHKYILKMCFNWTLKSITKDQRQMGKAINFGYAFGMGARKFMKYALTSYGIKIDTRQAEKTFHTYHKLYRTYSKWCDDERIKWGRLGFVRTPLGKVRKLLPEEQYTRIINTQVQGGAAEAIKTALVLLRKNCPSRAKLVLTVHDEIMLECDDQDPNIAKRLEGCMIEGFKKVFPEAPINDLIEAEFGANWVEAKP